MQNVEFFLNGEFVELHKLLKALGVSESGGAAKALVSRGEVLVDGAVELRKGFKLRPGHVVEAGDQRITVRVGQS
jgi:ribosome-associated protein